MKMIFQKWLYLMHYDSKEDIQPDIHDGCQFCFRRLYRYFYKSVLYKMDMIKMRCKDVLYL